MYFLTLLVSKMCAQVFVAPKKGKKSPDPSFRPSPDSQSG